MNTTFMIVGGGCSDGFIFVMAFMSDFLQFLFTGSVMSLTYTTVANPILTVMSMS